MGQRVLSVGNPKTRKGEKRGWITGVLHFLPHKYAGVGNLCANASPGCLSTCLVFAGRGGMDKTQEARKKKTLRFRHETHAFLTDLALDIGTLIRKAAREEKQLAIRLNGTSDLPWENIELSGDTMMSLFPDVQFYDYTKSFDRMKKFLTSGRWPKNYHLTFSRSELNMAECAAVLDLGGSVAVVVQEVPSNLNGIRFLGQRVRSGEDDDLRFLDPPRHAYLLRAKGLARKDTSGFVCSVEDWSGKENARTWARNGSAGERGEGGIRFGLGGTITIETT
jgi:hypothetical protein